jgi:CRP/FNR family transcriptional regulator
MPSASIRELQSIIFEGVCLQAEGQAGGAVPRWRHASDVSHEKLDSFFASFGRSLELPIDGTLSLADGKDLRLGYVRSGMLLTTINLSEDRRQVLCLHCPGDLVFALGASQSKAAKFRAVDAVAMFSLDEVSLRNAQEEVPGTVSMLFTEATQNIRRLLMHSAAIGRLRTEERLATFFLELALRVGKPAGDAVTFEFHMRREDIADYLSMNRDTLSRSLAKFRREGLISPVRPGLFIARWQGLIERTPLAESMMSDGT